MTSTIEGYVIIFVTNQANNFVILSVISRVGISEIISSSIVSFFIVNFLFADYDLHNSCNDSI